MAFLDKLKPMRDAKVAMYQNRISVLEDIHSGEPLAGDDYDDMKVHNRRSTAIQRAIIVGARKNGRARKKKLT